MVGISHKARNVDSPTDGTEWFQQQEPSSEQPDGSLVVAPFEMVTTHAYLQHPLIEVAHRVRLLDPESLKRLMALKELTAVELLNSPQQLRRWR